MIPDDVEVLWRKFLYAAYRDDVALHLEELTAWFRANGWNAEAATSLTERYVREMALLDEFEQSRREPT